MVVGIIAMHCSEEMFINDACRSLYTIKTLQTSH